MKADPHVPIPSSEHPERLDFFFPHDFVRLDRFYTIGDKLTGDEPGIVAQLFAPPLRQHSHHVFARDRDGYRKGR
ncbi:hypothetical protein AB0L65_44875 [Nonomuraea sp. NPDC052116]|uniref:hypothetical protein n=1 Tax=Nonomuraea sp. NPDC052116 TaxID=3155665 RepID=UPI0034487255